MADTKIGGMEGGDLGASPVGTEELWLQKADGTVDYFWAIDTLVTWLRTQNLHIRYVGVTPFGPTADCTTGDDKAHFHIPADMAGMNLVEVHAEVVTAGTTGTMDIQIRNITQAGVNMLSTALTIDTTPDTGSDQAAAPAVIDTGQDDVAENDFIAIDVDAVHTTAAKGLFVTLGFQTP